jgi:hypothetical protein
MSTQSCTQDPPATSQHDTRRAPRPHRGQPPWYRTAAIAIGAGHPRTAPQPGRT